MHAVPETKYVAVGGADVAYQTIGDGSFDLLYCIGATPIDVQWEHPLMASFLQGLASFSRLILFDRRGFGASGRVGTSTPTWEGWAHDLGMVLDAAGSEEAAIFAEEEAGPIAMMFAAMRPERVRALVLGNTSARLLIAEDYPIGMPVESVDGWLQPLVEHWGTEDFMRRSYPRRAADADFTRWGAKMMRALATPREAAAQYRYIFESLDVREALPLIGVPTLVLHSPLLPTPPIEHGRYIAEHISGARLVEVPGDNGWFYAGDQRRVLDEVDEFLTGETPPGNVDRVLTTVLYTDIVGSTERATSLGDAQWRRLLDRHDELIDREIKRFGGRLVKRTGDGVLASFDGPARAIRCAVACRDAARAVGLDIRAGLHTGEVERRGDDLGGIALHIGARVLAIAGPGDVLVSRTVTDLVAGSGVEFADGGEHELKGVSGVWRLFIVQA